MKIQAVPRDTVPEKVKLLWFEDWKHTMQFWAPLGFCFPSYASEFNATPKYAVLPMHGWDDKPTRKART